MNVASATRPGTARVPGRLQTVLVLAATAVLIAGAAWVIDTQASQDGFTEIEIVGAASPLRVGEKPPVFTAQAIDGSEISLADYAGKPIWLSFGASWCPDCRAEAPDMEAAWERHGPQGLVLLSIALEGPTEAKAYAERIGLTFPTIADPRNQIAGTFGLFGTPTHYFIGRDGTVQEIRLGGLQPEDMDALIASVMD